MAIASDNSCMSHPYQCDTVNIYEGQYPGCQGDGKLRCTVQRLYGKSLSLFAEHANHVLFALSVVECDERDEERWVLHKGSLEWKRQNNSHVFFIDD